MTDELFSLPPAPSTRTCRYGSPSRPAAKVRTRLNRNPFSTEKLLTLEPEYFSDLSKYGPKPKNGGVIGYPIHHTKPRRAQNSRDIEFTLKAEYLQLKEGEVEEDVPEPVAEKTEKVETTEEKTEEAEKPAEKAKDEL